MHVSAGHAKGHGKNHRRHREGGRCAGGVDGGDDGAQGARGQGAGRLRGGVEEARQHHRPGSPEPRTRAAAGDGGAPAQDAGGAGVRATPAALVWICLARVVTDARPGRHAQLLRHREKAGRPSSKASEQARVGGKADEAETMQKVQALGDAFQKIQSAIGIKARRRRGACARLAHARRSSRKRQRLCSARQHHTVARPLRRHWHRNGTLCRRSTR